VSGNYPPGVTGNEYEIAGAPVAGLEVECHVEGVTVVPIEVARGHLRWMKDWATLSWLTKDLATEKIRPMTGDERVDRIKVQVEAALADLEKAMRPGDEECGFSGEVDAEWFGNVRRWTCPWCGAEHEDDTDDGSL
jgi:hypothetical protein